MLAPFALLAAAISILAQASPIKVARQAPTTTTNQTATFENVTSAGFGLPPALPGVYKDLYFDLFEQGPYPYAAGFPVGIAPQSFPAEAVFGYGFTDPEGPAALRAAYDGSKVASFQLFDFYYGCQADYNYTYPGGSQVTKYPQECTLTVEGYTGDSTDGAPAVSQLFDFVPDFQYNSHAGVYYSTMRHAVLPESFEGLRVVTFNATNASPDALSDPAVYVDNVAYAVTDVASY